MTRGLYILLCTMNGRFFEGYTNGTAYTTTASFDKAMNYRTKEQAEAVAADLNDGGSAWVAMGVEEE